MEFKDNRAQDEIKKKKPSLAWLNYYLKEWARADNYDMAIYVYQEKILEEVFKKYPDNTDEQIVRFKCNLVDKFYSTNLKEAISPKFKHERSIVEIIIKEEDFDKKVRSNDEETQLKLIEDLKTVYSKRANDGTKEVTSFVSKYCSRHNPNGFPIYDRYVRELLYYINKYHPYTEEKFTKKALENDYRLYKKVIDAFRDKFFPNQKIGYKTLDCYLWTWAKEILRTP